MQTLTLPSGQAHYVAEEADTLQAMSVRELQALVMAFSDAVASTFGEAWFNNVVALANVYLEQIPAEAQSPADAEQEYATPPNVVNTEIEGQHKLDLGTHGRADRPYLTNGEQP